MPRSSAARRVVESEGAIDSQAQARGELKG